ncbi:MAG: S1C family serine protease [Akkermansiaceae bacterium]
MKALLFLLTASLLAAAPRKTPAELDAHLQKIAPDLVDATIAIFLGSGSGSGVIVSPDGLVITAAHVTGKANEKMTVLLADGRELPATSLGVDHTTDGALLQINAPGPFPYRSYIREKNYEIGDWVIATGHPGGPVIGRPAPFRLGRIYNAGTDSGFADPITTSAMVISGDSGGPLYNLKGEVIGINSNISGAWTVNNHVPMPSIIEKWDALLAGESFGEPAPMRGTNPDPENYFDEPYRSLRERYLQELDARPADDTEAAALKARPSLKDPHHMQNWLDKWEPDLDAPKSPRLGLRLALGESSRALISEVLPNSPAQKAGLKKDDVITKLNATPITSPTSLGKALSRLEEPASLSLTLANGRTLSLKPELPPARQHFPPPVAGLIPMMVGNTAASSPPSIRDLEQEFHASLAELNEELRNSVAQIYQGDELLIHATSVSGQQLITKASEIEDLKNLEIRLGNQTSPVRVVGVDKTRDIALISCDLEGLQPVGLRLNEAKVGALTLTAGKRTLTPGVITQPARVAPAIGYEHNVDPDQPSGYVGISLSPDQDKPTIASVELDSPADIAGLLEGDVITSFNKKKIETPDALTKQLSSFAPGQKVTFKVRREEEEITIPLILDSRPAKSANKRDRRAEMRDRSLSGLTANGGPISKRRSDFPLALYHDTRITAKEMGTPLLDVDGDLLGLNIARALRQRTLAIPVSEIRDFFREQLIEKQKRTD